MQKPKRFRILPRIGHKKKKKDRCPSIVFASAEFEIEALSDTYAPSSGVQATLQPRGNCQAAHTAIFSIRLSPSPQTSGWGTDRQC